MAKQGLRSVQQTPPSVPANKAGGVGKTVQPVQNVPKQVEEEEVTEEAQLAEEISASEDPERMAIFLCSQLHVDLGKYVYQSATENNPRLIEKLLENGAPVNWRDPQKGTTPLWAAARQGFTDVVKVLLERGANVSTPDLNGSSPLYVAAGGGHLDVVESLIRAKADVNQATKSDVSPLFIASQYGNTEVVKRLLEANADTSLGKQPDLFTPLLAAAQIGHVDIVNLLIKKGVNVHQTSSTGASALFLACNHGHTDIAKFLLESGADPNQKNSEEMTPIQIASVEGHLDIVKLLVKAKADVNIKSGSGSPISLAVERNHVELVKVLLEASASTQGLDLVQNALKNVDPELASLLVNSGVDLEQKDIYGRNAGILAAMYGNASMWFWIEGNRGIYSQKIEGQSGDSEALVEYPSLSDYGIVPIRKVETDQFGTVWQGLKGNQYVAVKILKDTPRESVKGILEEASLLGAIKHPDIISYLEVVHEIPATVFQFAEKGNLHAFLTSRSEPVAWALRMMWAMEISDALIYLHNNDIVHRDIRLSSFLLTDSLDVKLSDFGATVWSTLGDEFYCKPYFISGKEAYTFLETEETYKPTFDLRLFGIVLRKFLLFGDKLESDLYDWRSDSLAKNLTCDKPVYKELIQFCCEPTATAPWVAALIRSICIEEFQAPQDIPNQVEETEGSLMSAPFGSKTAKRVAALEKIASSRVISTYYLGVTSSMFNSYEEKVQRSAIASASLVPPFTLIKSARNLAELDKQTESVRKESLDKIFKRLHKHRADVAYVVSILLRLADEGANDPRTLKILLSLISLPSREVRVMALKSLSRAKLLLQAKDVLLQLLQTERNPEVLPFLSGALFELKSEEVKAKVISVLTSRLADTHWRIRKGVAAAIGKSIGSDASEELKQKAYAELCATQDEELTVVEKLWIVTGIRHLGIGQKDALERALSFLKDSDPKVKYEAGLTVAFLSKLQ